MRIQNYKEALKKLTGYALIVFGKELKMADLTKSTFIISRTIDDIVKTLKWETN